MEFEGYNGRIRLEGEDLVIDREGVKGRFGGDVLRRIPLDDVEGAHLEPAPEPRKPGYLQLVLVDGPDEELTRAQAIVDPDVVTFSARQQPAFARLWDWLENGGDLEDEDAPAAEAPAPAAAPPAAAPAAAPPAPAGPVDPFAEGYRGPAGAGAPAPAAPVAIPVAASPYAASPYGAPDAPTGPAGRLGMGAAVTKALKGYATFAGRSRRSEYWWFTLASLVVYVVAAVVDAVLGTSALTLVVTLALLLPSLSVAVRRLHDTGRSGAWYFLSLLPLIGTIVLFVFFAKEGEPQANAYGPPPK